METWKIMYIPDKPPIPPENQPTVNVVAAYIDPKFANTLIRRLNQIAQLESLRHVKRVQKKHLEGGKTQLSVVLCVAGENEDQCSISHEVKELITTYQLNPFTTKVCKYAASSKEEWEEQCKLWPTSFHPPTFNIDGITGFSDEDSQSVSSFMSFAIQLAKSGSGSVVNAAVIVDPSVKQVIADARDQVFSGDTARNGIILETKLEEAFEAVADTEGLVRCKTLHSNGLPDNPEQLDTCVSCLHPWDWALQETHLSYSNWHPLRHAAIVAIESSAARDRHLFPSSGEILDTSTNMNHLESSSTGSPAKKQRTDLKDEKVDGIPNICCESSHCASAKPYLCTGYDIYLVWEPCTMCAMALVHQRIRRIFYAFPNPKAGALGSVRRLQGEKSLNHHYAVFQVLVPDRVLECNDNE
ncbi:hypothetical protein UlMin_043313 [Ulmus minor]